MREGEGGFDTGRKWQRNECGSDRGMDNIFEEIWN